MAENLLKLTSNIFGDFSSLQILEDSQKKFFASSEEKQAQKTLLFSKTWYTNFSYFSFKSDFSNIMLFCSKTAWIELKEVNGRFLSRNQNNRKIFLYKYTLQILFHVFWWIRKRINNFAEKSACCGFVLEDPWQKHVFWPKICRIITFFSAAAKIYGL